MIKDRNIFIEGIQGMGKSTLLQAIARKAPELQVCREGDYSPVELAWCTWMDEGDYRAVLARYGKLRREIEAHTFQEGSHYIIPYTTILTDIPGFHKDLEQYEIYNVFADVPREGFLLLYLYDEHLEESTRMICEERADDQGNPLWYPLMMDYLKSSPYGKAHGYQGFDDLIRHFRHRQQLELRILREVAGHRAVILPAKRWDIGEVLDIIAGQGICSGAEGFGI